MTRSSASAAPRRAGWLARLLAKLRRPRAAPARAAAAAPTPALPPAISREALAALPLRRYEGCIVSVSTPQELAAAGAALRAADVVGFDTETRPAFRKGEHYAPCLLQFAAAQTVYLFRLEQPAAHALLREVLEAPHIVKAGVSVSDDLRELQAVFGCAPRAVVDLGTLARRNGLAQTGVRNLAGLLLGFRIAKGSKTSNWAAPQLTAAQVSYAATDAWVCRELYLEFRRRGLLA